MSSFSPVSALPKIVPDLESALATSVRVEWGQSVCAEECAPERIGEGRSEHEPSPPDSWFSLALPASSITPALLVTEPSTSQLLRCISTSFQEEKGLEVNQG